MRSPLLPKNKKFVSVELLGDKHAAVNQIVDNGMLGDNQLTYLKQPKVHWHKMSTHAGAGPQYRIYLELATKWNLPAFPFKERVFKDLTSPQDLNLPKYNLVRDPRSYFGVMRVVLHDVDETPRNELVHLLPLFSGEAPFDLAAMAAGYQQLFQSALDSWAKRQANDNDIRLLSWLFDHKLLTNRSDASPRLKQLVYRYRKLEGELSLPRIVDGRADYGPGHDEHVQLRGNVTTLGKQVPRGYLELVTGSQEGFNVAGSGRLKLAETIANPNNQLTARVMANRIWYYLFGRGIVSTVNDFGRLGERPSHPELLDYLAERFVADGWSIKRLIRSLVLSQTFRQSSQVSPQAEEIDPANRLLSHFTARRLEAESVRDAVLAVSGRLDRRLYGPPIQPYCQPSDMKLKLLILSGPLDGFGRRSVYTKIDVMAMPSFLAAFDQPLPRMSRGTRDITHLPRQALTMMNDPFVHGMADYWAKQLVQRNDDSTADRLHDMAQRAFGRPCSQNDESRIQELLVELARLHGVSDPNVLSHKGVWKDVAHALFNLSEFVYLQ